jgi:hypothetical protein
VLAALLELPAHLFDAFAPRGSVSAAMAAGLGEAGDVAGHLALQLVDGVDGVARAADVADAPAGHRKALAVAVEGERALQQPRMQTWRS